MAVLTATPCRPEKKKKKKSKNGLMVLLHNQFDGGCICVSPLHSAAYRAHDQDQSVLSTAGLQTGTDATGQKSTGQLIHTNHNMIKSNLSL